MAWKRRSRRLDEPNAEAQNAPAPRAQPREGVSQDRPSVQPILPVQPLTTFRLRPSHPRFPHPSQG